MILTILIIVAFLLLDRIMAYDEMRKATECLHAIDMKLIVLQMHLDTLEITSVIKAKAEEAESV